MDRYWEPKTLAMVKRALAYAGMIILWIGISLGLSQLEKSGMVFDLAPILQCKTLAVVLLFAGRGLLFPHYRLAGRVRWLFGVLVLGIGADRMLKSAGQDWGWGYAGLVIGDTLLWAGFLAFLIETVAALYCYWYNAFKGDDPGAAIGLWRSFWRDSIRLAVWLALVFGVGFYYLVNFYLLDVFFYSWFFLGVFGITLFGLWGMSHWRYNRQLRGEVEQLDQQLHAYLQWRDLEAAHFAEELPRYYYLYLTREVLVRKLRPVVCYPAMLVWGGCAVFLLSLPYLIGIAIKV